MRSMPRRVALAALLARAVAARGPIEGGALSLLQAKVRVQPAHAQGEPYEVGAPVLLHSLAEGPDQGSWLRGTILGPGPRKDSYNVHVWAGPEGTRQRMDVPAELLKDASDLEAKEMEEQRAKEAALAEAQRKAEEGRLQAERDRQGQAAAEQAAQEAADKARIQETVKKAEEAEKRRDEALAAAKRAAEEEAQRLAEWNKRQAEIDAKKAAELAEQKAAARAKAAADRAARLAAGEELPTPKPKAVQAPQASLASLAAHESLDTLMPTRVELPAAKKNLPEAFDPKTTEEAEMTPLADPGKFSAAAHDSLDELMPTRSQAQMSLSDKAEQFAKSAVTVSVKDMAGKEAKFAMRRHLQMKVLMRLACGQLYMDCDQTKFFKDGAKVRPEDTVGKLASGNGKTFALSVVGPRARGASGAKIRENPAVQARAMATRARAGEAKAFKAMAQKEKRQ